MPPLAGAIDVVDWGVVPNKDHPPVSLQLTALASGGQIILFLCPVVP